MYINYPLDTREKVIFIGMSVISGILAGSCYIVGALWGGFICLFFSLFTLGMLWSMARHPNGFRVGYQLGYGNMTGDNLKIPFAEFERGQGRMECGYPVEVYILNPLSYEIEPYQICRVTIVEKVGLGMYKGWMSIHPDDLY